MTVTYRGEQNYGRKSLHRIAEINYDEEREGLLMAKMIKPLELKGWSIDNGVEGWAAVEVEDREEYKAFMRDYKEVKKAAKLWIRFGI